MQHFIFYLGWEEGVIDVNGIYVIEYIMPYWKELGLEYIGGRDTIMLPSV